MSTPNRVSADIPASVVTEVTNHLNAVRTLLEPYLEVLTPDERKTMAKMSDKTIAFVTKAEGYTKTNPEFVPSFMELPEFYKDMTLVLLLKPMLDIAEQIASNIDDTTMLGGSEAYMAALLYYASVKMAAKTNQPGAKVIYEDLSMRFPGNAGKRKPSTKE
jgi:hypothetical protein